MGGAPTPTRRGWTMGARVLGVLVSLAWLLPLIGGLVGEENVETTETAAVEGLVLTMLVIVAIIATAVSFVRPAVGGRVVLGTGIALAVFAAVTAGRNHWIAVLVAGVPWMAVGASFIRSGAR